MQKIPEDLEVRILSIEQRLDNMEKHAVKKGDFEKEFTALLKKHADTQNHDCDDWINAILGS